MVRSLGVGMGGRDKKKESLARGRGKKERKKKTVWESQEHLYFAF